MASTTDKDLTLNYGLAQIHFDPEAFDELIIAHGIVLEHFRAMRCVVGMASLNDPLRAHEDHSNCSNGFIYTKAGTIKCLFSGNSAYAQKIDPGIVTGSSCMVTFPRYYCGTTDETFFAPFDRLYFTSEKISVVHWQTFAAHQTGFNRLNFPVIKVFDLMDSNGISYTCGDGYEITNDGQLKWLKHPGIDPMTGKGLVCSIRYTYRPYYYVARLIHEIRVQTTEDAIGNLATMRLPQQAVLNREFVFQKNAQDELWSSDTRLATSNPDGSFEGK